MRVSVVIPAYNREKLIEATLESVSRQSLPPLETIVVDDASNDGTAAIVEAWSNAHPGSGVRLIRQPVNAGVSAARNRGIQEARGEWIAFLDSDDLWEPEHLEKLAAHGSAADVVFSRARGFSDDDSHASGKTWTSRFNNADEVVREMIGACHILPSASMVRKKSLQDVGRFDEDRRIQHAEDWDLWLKLIEAKAAFALCPEFTCLYRQHADSACQRKARLYRAVVRCLAKHKAAPQTEWLAWRKSFGYYQGKLARACLEEGEPGAVKASASAVVAAPWSARFYGGLVAATLAKGMPMTRPWAQRFVRRFL